MKKAERLYLGDVASMGCIVCRNSEWGESPAEIHHIRNGQGMSQRASNYETIPLCPAIYILSCFFILYLGAGNDVNVLRQLYF